MDNERIQRLHKFMKDFKMFLRDNYYDIENKDIQWYLRGLVQNVNESKERTMDYEKAYKEALERARESLKDGGISQNSIDYIQSIFPELKESEGERIRKNILDCIQYMKDNYYIPSRYTSKQYDTWIAWLEKQGESKFEQSIQEGDKIVTNEDGTHFNVSQLKRVAKKEPKFKVGDEIKIANEESLIITKIDNKGYWSKDLFICDFDEECLWDLVEQKPINDTDEELVNAVKDTSVLDLVEPKSAWSEEDEENMNNVLYIFNQLKDTSFYKEDDIAKKTINWLKSLKERMKGE